MAFLSEWHVAPIYQLCVCPSTVDAMSLPLCGTGEVSAPFDASEVQAQLRQDMPDAVAAAAAFASGPEQTVRAPPIARVARGGPFRRTACCLSCHPILLQDC